MTCSIVASLREDAPGRAARAIFDITGIMPNRTNAQYVADSILGPDENTEPANVWTKHLRCLSAIVDSCNELLDRHKDDPSVEVARLRVRNMAEHLVDAWSLAWVFAGRDIVDMPETLHGLEVTR